MSAGGEGWLSGLWYPAAAARALKPGEMRRERLFGEAVVLGRTQSGAPFALVDRCPHRAAPLSSGRVAGETVECPYHGWRFAAADGRCAAAPALADEAAGGALSSIRVRRFPVEERGGVLWIFNGDAPDASAPELWQGGGAPKIAVRIAVDGPFDEAAIGLVDPAHTPVVHRQWWWREGAARGLKQKTFEPTPLGFRMPPHAPSANSRIYRLLGGRPVTEIEFRLPALRIETVTLGKRTIVSATAIAPAQESAAHLWHFLYWDMPALDFIRPIIRSMAEDFLAQDAAILRAQAANLREAPHRPLFVGDPDEPAKWYLKLKKAWAARRPGEAFVNPLTPTRLSWRT